MFQFFANAFLVSWLFNAVIVTGVSPKINAGSSCAFVNYGPFTSTRTQTAATTRQRERQQQKNTNSWLSVTNSVYDVSRRYHIALNNLQRNPHDFASTSTTSASTTTNRRQWLQQVSFLICGAATGSDLVETTNNNDSVANAACLPGDLSKECIGVYKVPIDDAILPYVGTPEALKTYAPDLSFVAPLKEPESFSRALEILQTQRIAASDIQAVVLAGRLEEAGIKVLNLVAQVTLAGRKSVNAVTTMIEEQQQKQQKQQGDKTSSGSVINQLKMTKLQDQLNMVLALWGECDVMIGLGIRGEMGVSAAAQLQILESLREATAALDDFLALVVSWSSS